MKEKKSLYGLSKEEVQKRIDEGLVNREEETYSKSYKRIFYDNVFTLFNLINAVLAVLILMTGSYKNVLFLGVVFSNIFIGTFQEIRAKRTLDSISLINNMKVIALRDGKEQEIALQDIVVDDLLKVKSGSQIVADSVVVEGTLEVDESLLSGESDMIVKKVGDTLYSGSFVVGSHAYIRVEKVGSDNYASRLVKNAKVMNRYPSELRDHLNQIIKFIGLFIIPLGCLLFMKEYLWLHNSFEESVLSMSAALIGMIPEGLVILTSIALAVGTIHLAKHRTLVQELYCLETLARVDVLCLDKTGTITEGKMEVDHHVALCEELSLLDVIGNLMQYLEDDNATLLAMKEAYAPCQTWTFQETIPFNSKRKYSGVIFQEKTYLMGAYEFLVKERHEAQQRQVEQFAEEGYRVITIAASSMTQKEKVLEDVEILGFVLLRDKIRESAAQTLAYFKKQGVEIKVISGDHPISVSQVAKRAGLDGYDKYIDASLLQEEALEQAVREYQIFGRVSPQQKKLMMQYLKKQGHTVGMSGDGVNDVLAFKEADVSIAMASGSDVAKSSANLVLLDSHFDALPYVLYEGRRVINNIQRVATLFLTKTIFSFMLACMTLFLSIEYPFVPIHLTFVSTLTIGIPAFFMALEPNRNRVEKNFLENVLKVSLPAALSVILCIAFVVGSAWIKGFGTYRISQLCLIIISINGLLVLSKVARPYTRFRLIILTLACIGIVLGLGWGYDILDFQKIHLADVGYYITVFIIVLLSVSKVGSHIVKRIYDRKKRRDGV